jgi:bifunctional UDP-N-acetylglucosamine pyrophosphorylase/glucosamine-1-phosphate N-acetyltransferase
VNVGAGSITANFDGREVYRTTVGDDSYIGSGAVLIAPLTLEAGAHIGAGKVVSQKDADKLGAKG